MAKTGKSTRAIPAAERVADAALALAAAGGWYAVSMRDLAARLQVDLAALAAHYRDPDAIADLVFARAQEVMLAETDPDLPPRRRVERALWRWFDALAPHRKAAVAMLRAKLHPPHPHHWGKLPFHLSRLIWWLREAALLDAQGRRRQHEEVVLSGIFLAALASWAADASEGQARTRRRVARLFDRVAPLLWR